MTVAYTDARTDVCNIVTDGGTSQMVNYNWVQLHHVTHNISTNQIIQMTVGRTTIFINPIQKIILRFVLEVFIKEI